MERRLTAQRVTAITLDGDQAVLTVAGAGERRYDSVVVAVGAATPGLAGPLGIHVSVAVVAGQDIGGRDWISSDVRCAPGDARGQVLGLVGVLGGGFGLGGLAAGAAEQNPPYAANNR